jgi:antitoxin ParD1/3/4
MRVGGNILSRQSGKISVNLTSDLAGFVQEQTKSGKYTSASEVVQEALRLLEAAERFRADRLRDVRTKIAEGLASLNRGEGLDGEDVFRELEAAISGPRGKKSRR